MVDVFDARHLPQHSFLMRKAPMVRIGDLHNLPSFKTADSGSMGRCLDPPNNGLVADLPSCPLRLGSWLVRPGRWLRELADWQPRTLLLRTLPMQLRKDRQAVGQALGKAMAALVVVA